MRFSFWDSGGDEPAQCRDSPLLDGLDLVEQAAQDVRVRLSSCGVRKIARTSRSQTRTLPTNSSSSGRSRATSKAARSMPLRSAIAWSSCSCVRSTEPGRRSMMPSVSQAVCQPPAGLRPACYRSATHGADRHRGGRRLGIGQDHRRPAHRREPRRRPGHGPRARSLLPRPQRPAARRARGPQLRPSRLARDRPDGAPRAGAQERAGRRRAGLRLRPARPHRVHGPAAVAARHHRRGHPDLRRRRRCGG